MSDDATRIGGVVSAPPRPPAGDDPTRVATTASSDATRVTTTTSSDATRISTAARGGASPATERLDKPIEIGEVLGHTYRIEAFVAQGGMGAVYRARHTILDTVHAVKVIVRELARDPEILELLKNEAKTLSKVKNEGIVEYQGIFRDEFGRRYLVMEFVDGPSLAHVLRERQFTPAEVRQLKDRLALGLAAAHDRGIFHRDLSPDNIILADGKLETAKIIDFGIAKATEAGEASLIEEEFAGKYSYVSPEQAGLYGGRIDGRSDMYSLALVLAAAAMGYGKKLVMGNSLPTVIEARQAVPDLSPIPEELRAELTAMLQPNPDDRPKTLRDIVSAEALVAAGQAGAAVALPGAEQQRGRSGMVYGALAASIIIAVGVGGWAIYRSSLPTDVTPQLEHRIADELDRIRCSTLQSQLTPNGKRFQATVSGYVPAQGDLDELSARLGAFPEIARVETAVRIVPWPFCDAVKATALAGGGENAASPHIDAGHADLVYKEGEFLAFDVTAPDGGPGYLYVDGLDQDGNVLHFLPTPQRPDNAVEAGKVVHIGTPDGKPTAGLEAYEMSPPFGRQMLIAIASKEPLFRSPREQVENAASYFVALGAALAAAKDQGAVASWRFMEVVPKQ